MTASQLLKARMWNHRHANEGPDTAFLTRLVPTAPQKRMAWGVWPSRVARHLATSGIASRQWRLLQPQICDHAAGAHPATLCRLYHFAEPGRQHPLSGGDEPVTIRGERDGRNGRPVLNQFQAAAQNGSRLKANSRSL
jgi:hypothetical protein